MRNSAILACALEFLIYLVALIGLSTATSAHVKWFTHIDGRDHAIPPAALLTSNFIAVFCVVLFLVFLGFLFDGWIAKRAVILDQVVTEKDKAPAKRGWHIRDVFAGALCRTLSDAVSPVLGDVAGNRLELHFRMKGGLRADQVLDLSPDHQSARNVMTLRKSGVAVATLHETIRKVGS